MAIIGQDIEKAKEFLEAGQLVAIPTETVYGLAGNALDVGAVAKIFETKNRPSFDPLIVHTDSIEKIGAFVCEIPEALRKLGEKFWPGPLTILLEKKAIIPDLVTAGLSRVAVRVPRHSLTRSLLQELDFPLAAPSANPFGYISPTQASHVAKQLGDKIPYILDGGSCEVGLESTIVGMEDGKVTVYRLGGLDLNQITEVVGEVEIKSHSSSNPAAPGLLKSHYAPTKEFILGDLDELVPEMLQRGRPFGVLSLNKRFTLDGPAPQFQLSPSGDLVEAARNLFDYLRQLDQSGVEVIVAELMPENGLGRAINDRLRRAAAKG
ncbi:threonylcarbamoyl-AMP synthase [Algoriphagus kandeliae]|uniref:Threonylcarbamoyl-AMP synthase n=1 Tax=Algoriphagus kandeliae TaxID=2562278 RepID=A0A4Y9QKV6_9BACT|nr:L-threonylcarbamoyladenylate synthase [Algoriphagus kandeliae]TFV93319.1 threonylcarbamoyl-AMP synthase [Algoriphagus kandeliae]